ncbi:MAG TPA: hypothetical protein VJW95_05815, partial [Dissulfurispiraceae bacterium]|nr:hypothetical protein [Dissulfurispiraceae bacterium]
KRNPYKKKWFGGLRREMRYQSLEDYIATLSEREKEQYQSLIEESRQRDSSIKKNFDALRQNIGALCESQNSGVKAIGALRIQVGELKTNMLRLHLRYAKAVCFLELRDRKLPQHYPTSLN